MSAFAYRTVPCTDCHDGRVSVPRRWSGEGNGGELVDDLCDTCGGTGEEDAACAHCERIEPLDGEGFCAACAFIPDEALTEVHGDPMLRRVA